MFCLTSPAHNMHLDEGWGLSSYAKTEQRYHRQAPLLVHSSALSLSQTVWVCRELGSLSFPSPLSRSLSLLPTHRLSADVARGRSGPWPSGPCVYVCVCVCVCVCACVCVSLAPPNPAVMCYRWDLRLSVSASAARRRRKQDARGSTVISQRALFHTIPGRSLYSLHAGLPLDIYMCQQSHCYWPT